MKNVWDYKTERVYKNFAGCPRFGSFTLFFYYINVCVSFLQCSKRSGTASKRFGFHFLIYLKGNSDAINGKRNRKQKADRVHTISIKVFMVLHYAGVCIYTYYDYDDDFPMQNSRRRWKRFGFELGRTRRATEKSYCRRFRGQFQKCNFY